MWRKDGLDWSNDSMLNLVLMFLTRCLFRRRTDYSSYSTVQTGWRFIRTLTGWRSTVRTGRGSIRTLQAGCPIRQAGCPMGQVGCPTGQVVLLEASLAIRTTEIFVRVLSVSRTAKYLLATGTPEEISPPEERRTFRTDSRHTPD